MSNLSQFLTVLSETSARFAALFILVNRRFNFLHPLSVSKGNYRWALGAAVQKNLQCSIYQFFWGRMQTQERLSPVNTKTWNRIGGSEWSALPVPVFIETRHDTDAVRPESMWIG